MDYSESGEMMAETAHGPRSVFELEQRKARPELHAAADAVAQAVDAGALLTVQLSYAELIALDELVMSGASIMLRTRGYAFPRELASAHRKLQVAASN